MFSKIALLALVVAAFFATSEAQYLAAPAAYAYPAYSAVYSPYAYAGYPAAYPAYYAWGSNKGGPAPAGGAPSGSKLTNNQ